MYGDLESNSVPYLIGSPHSKIDTQPLGSPIHRRVKLPADFCLPHKIQSQVSISVDIRVMVFTKTIVAVAGLLSKRIRKRAEKSGKVGPQTIESNEINVIGKTLNQ